MQPIEFKSAPETMPAIEPQDMPTVQAAGGAESWGSDDVQITGATPELEEFANDSLEAWADYYRGISQGSYAKHAYSINLYGEDSWRNFLTIDSPRPGELVANLDGFLSEELIDVLADQVACKMSETVKGIEILQLNSTKPNANGFTYFGGWASSDGCADY
ncbi:hypothetical protein [Glutamicibacter sp. NPDC087344]|uniref:hypothetical protein n=1 Tax=Glutamicibacter sp. NPDC087344 TaxID=3363994 RepID=UPI0037F4FF54